MGRVRSDGYHFDSPTPGTNHAGSGTVQPVTPVSRPPLPPTAASSVAPAARPPGPARTGASGPARSGAPGTGRPRDRIHRNRRPKNTGCRNPQVRRGVGSCVFVLGIPCLIAGLILTIVSSTDEGEDDKKYPASFPVLGPILLGLSVVCFVAGVLLYNSAILKSMRDCLNLTDKDSFCRRRFPRLSAWLKPDLMAARNRAAINNLQTAPARSAMRKIPNPDLVTVETELRDSEGQGEGHSRHHQGNHHHHHYHRHHPPNQYPPRRKRAVTFSQGSEADGIFVPARQNSVSSEPDRLSWHSENGANSLNGQSPSTSLLSLRHCKVHPKDDVFWTESSAGGSQGGGGEGEGGGYDVGGENGGHPTAASDSAAVVTDGGGDDGGGSVVGDGSDSGSCGGVKFSLNGIDEERA